MDYLQECKYVNAIPPAAALDNTSATTNSVKVAGFAKAAFIIALGATDIAVTALKVQESDDDSSYSDVTGAIFGTSTNSAGSTSSLPTATSDNNLYAIFVNLQGRKKYLKLVATFGDGSVGGYIQATCILGGGSTLLSAAGQNFAQTLIV